jgi:hypothetical protein
MQPAVASNEKAFRHVLQFHMHEELMSDDEISLRITGMEEIDIRKPKEVFGLAYPPFMTWSRKDNCLEYLRAIVYLTDRQYELERYTSIFGQMAEQVQEEFKDVTNFSEYAHGMETRLGSIRLLTFLTGEIHPEPKFSFEGVDWPAVDVPNYDPTAPDWFISERK